MQFPEAGFAGLDGAFGGEFSVVLRAFPAPELLQPIGDEASHGAEEQE